MSGASNSRFMIWVSRARNVAEPHQVSVVAHLAAVDHVLQLNGEDRQSTPP